MTMLHPIVPETEESGAVSAYVPGIARLCCGRNRPAKARTRVRNCARVVGWSAVKRAETTSSSAAASRQLAPSARRPNTCTAGLRAAARPGPAMAPIAAHCAGSRSAAASRPPRCGIISRGAIRGTKALDLAQPGSADRSRPARPVCPPPTCRGSTTPARAP